MLRKRPIPKRSQRSLAWQAYKLRERLAVMRRPVEIDDVRYPSDTCEGCGKRTDHLQLAHIFGRRPIVGEPLASSRYLTAKLCHYDPFGDAVGCHEKIDRYLDPGLRERLEEQAASRLLDAFKIEGELRSVLDRTLTPDGRVRWMDSHTDSHLGGDEQVREVLQLRSYDGLMARS